MLRYYGYGSLRDVLRLPMKQFWMLSKNIDRLAAEEDIRLLSALVSAQSEQGFKGYMEDRRKVMGTVVEYDAAALAAMEAQQAEDEYDREGLRSLIGMGKW